jgi:MFS family permease
MGVRIHSSRNGLHITMLYSLTHLWKIIGAQIPTYFISASLSFITADIGGTEVAAWLPVSIGLAQAAVSPFCGYLQDIFGRRAITLIGSLLLVTGTVVMGTAHHFTQGIVAVVLVGAGSAIAELTALAGYVLCESLDGLIIKLIVDFRTAELVPISKRGYYLAIVTGSILPFAPYLLYAELLSTYYS